MPKRLAILGSTGSIGRQALDVVADAGDLEVCALAAGGNWQLLGEQARRFGVPLLALADGDAAEALRGALPPGTELLSGAGAMTELVRRARPDVLLTGVVGSAGLEPTLAGIECGADLAIANKETLVVAGSVVINAARDAGVNVLPVDSEHSALAQCLRAGRREEVCRVVITSSGGALRDRSDEEAAEATADDALNHPTWAMGPKITVDSATLMNKALEVIEAHWLFDLPAERIEVVIHPESIVHAMVEFCDGSCIAQLARPDMTGPIAYALGHPCRPQREIAPLALASLGSLTFRPLHGRFARAVDLGYEVIRRGGNAGALVNGANEAAVEAFLAGRISFGQIVPMVETILNRGAAADEGSLSELIAADARAREQLRTAIEAGQTGRATETN